MKNYPKKLWAIAYHEAGHAVMAKLNNLRITSISIVPDKASLGRVFSRNPLAEKLPDANASTPNRWRMERRVKMLLAGVIAERKFERQNSYRRQNPHGAEYDYDEAVSLVSHHCGSDVMVEAYLGLLHEMTRLELDVSENWKIVENLAAFLIERGEVSGNDARKWFRENQR